jgi:hypothetical protein
MNSILQRCDIIYHMQAMCQNFRLDWDQKLPRFSYSVKRMSENEHFDVF